MRIEILCTGDEILTGKTVNTNYSHIARRLADIGFEVQRGVTVGDDRDALLAAFREAAARSDAVIVNGGLGPTVDDLSQEVAAEAAGVDLVLHEEWLARMQEFYARRNRVMPANNRKQAMLPASAEMIDNPIGTACGFALAIGKARFFFTPGVPREMRRMLDEQVLPRLLAQSGMKGVSRLKRFHTFGIGESRADEMLAGIDSLAIDGAVKLGFQAHYPQLETKLAARGLDAADLDAKLAAVEAEVRRRLGNFVVAEDDQTLEGVLLSALSEQGATVSVVEMFTSGHVAARLAPLEGAEAVFRQGLVARDLDHLAASLGIAAPAVGPEAAVAAAGALAARSGATYGLAVLIELDQGADRLEFGGTICIGIAGPGGSLARPARMLGGRDWVRIGATELALDALRRHLQGLPVDERIDFERR